MAVLFALIGLFSQVMIVVSLIKPKWGTFGKRPEWGRKKTALAWLAAFIVSIIIVGTSTSIPTPTNKPVGTKKQVTATENTPTEDQHADKEDESPKYIFSLYYGFGEDQAKAIEDALTDVGVKEIKDVTKKGNHDYVLDVDAGVYTPDKDTMHIECDDNNQLQTITYKQIILWNEGKPIHQLSEYVLSASEELEVTRTGKDMVKKTLKAPSTAKFISKTFKYIKIQDEITFIGKVDAQNSFGAMVRSPFKVQFRYIDGKLTPTYFMVNHQQII